MSISAVISAIIGGSLIGLVAALLLFTHNRVAGISGIAAGILPPWNNESPWRASFLTGMLLSVPLYRSLLGEIPLELSASLPVLAIAGLLVGYGSRLGGGCTSGHGVCGIARLSTRSIVATLVFMLAAGLVVFGVRHGF